MILQAVATIVRVTIFLQLADWTHLTYQNTQSRKFFVPILPGIFLACLALILFAPGSRAQVNAPTVLPTDINPIPGHPESLSPLSAFQLRLWQHTPSSFYYTGTIESTFRLETNPFQYPEKGTLWNELIPPGTDISNLNPGDIASDAQEVSHAYAADNVYRINPTFTAGWALTPKTQVFGMYFLIRDSLLHYSTINSTTQAVGVGIQHTYMWGEKTSIQPQFISRELWQTGEPPVHDLLPTINIQTNVTPNVVAYLSALLQLRFINFLGYPMRELDPMYSAGLIWQRGPYTFIASGTFLQSFRHPFGKYSLLPVDNYTWILDFEIDKQLFKKMPGLQAIVRAEPVFNFHDQNTPGISGADFRLYYGLRLSAFKPWLNGSIQQLRKRYQMTEEPNP
jgi:hypothetical protein